MSSWVRYCVTVYIGLLLSGALARPPWDRPSLGQTEPAPARLHDAQAQPAGPISKELPRDPTPACVQDASSDTLAG